VPPESLIVRPIRRDDVFNSLSLGHKDYQPLKTFLKKHACAYEACSLARTHVLVDANGAAVASRVWGYITLAASEVVTTDQNRPQSATWPDGFHLPSIKLARMAIDVELQRQGWGRTLLDFAIALVNDHVSRHVGCRLLTTDAKADAVSFYEKSGFTMLNTPTNKDRKHPVMFIMLDKLTTP
jgi:GNAT superfamily N-acetyltransferase